MGNIAIVVDASALIHRAYHAIPPFRTRSGVPTNALHGFIMMLSRIMQRDVDYLVVCLDRPAPTFRKTIDPTYQSKRKKAPDDLKTQFPLVHEFLDTTNIATLYKDGFEADDVIGTVTAYFTRHEIPVTIVTGDRDMFQLVNPTVTVAMPKGMTFQTVDPLYIQTQFGILPSEIIDYKALVGDASDNYRGVDGIGPTRATSLLQHYHSLEGIFEHIDELPQTTKKLLIHSRDQAFKMRTLATVVTTVPLSMSLTQFKVPSFNDDINGFFEKYELHSAKRAFEKVMTSKLPSKVTENQLSFFYDTKTGRSD